MPSYRSRKSGEATGNVTSVGVTVSPCRSSTMVPTLLICDWPWFSPAVPVTRTTSPRLTVFALLPLNTKMPSDVAGSASPTGSWMKKPRSAGEAPS